MMGSEFLSICVLALLASEVATTGPTVKITNGTVTGYNCGGALCFRGIPFAQPPVGSLRFMPPIHLMNTSQFPLNATNPAPMCAQQDQSPIMFHYSEDCLYLNVFTPNLTGKLPVMVFIHGGSYIHGGAQEYGDSGPAMNLASRGIVVVIIQYRLGVLGFMTTGTPDLPANLAMLDQIQAMKWVQAEVENFGGDPLRVTLQGESSGSASVSLHTYSPLSRGLFQQAIMESGVSRNPWAIQGNFNVQQHTSEATAIGAGCITPQQWSINQFSGLRACLQKIPAQQLLQISKEHYPQSAYTWGPSVGTPEGFLPTWPRNLEKNRTLNMPILMGNNRDEDFPSIYAPPPNISIYNQTRFKYALLDLSTPGEFGDKAQAVQNLLQDNYTPDAPPNDYLSWLRAFVSLQSDRTFYAGTAEEVSSLEKTTRNLYLYSLDYLSAAAPYPVFNGSKVKGASHALDLVFVFNFTNIMPFYGWTLSPTDLKIVEFFGIMWTNFVKTGNPNYPHPLHTNWSAHDTRTNSYYSITANSSMSNYFHYKANQIWNNIVPALTQSTGPTFPAPTQSNYPCALNPCLNGGICKPLSPGKFSCSCPTNFGGNKCQLPICHLTIANRGAFVLEVTTDAGAGPTNSYLALGRQIPVTAVINGRFQLRAVFGGVANCLLSQSFCQTNQTITCRGTTLGISCAPCA